MPKYNVNLYVDVEANDPVRAVSRVVQSITEGPYAISPASVTDISVYKVKEEEKKDGS